MQRKRVDLTTGPITKKLILFAIPIILSNLLQHLYSAADRMVVGRFAEEGTNALAAVGATGSAITLLLGLFTGFSIAVNILCANINANCVFGYTTVTGEGIYRLNSLVLF